MITTDFCRSMAAYNSEMNRRFLAAAATLDEAARTAPAGAFWGSIHGTLNHLLWADAMWMARFEGTPLPAVPLAQSGALTAGFPELQAARAAMDRRIEAWAARLDQGALSGRLTWFSGAAQREVTRPMDLLVTHFFNHQTHHRGQVHALLTARGAATGDTDLWLVLP